MRPPLTMPVTTRIITCLGPRIPKLTLICFDCILGRGHTQCIHGVYIYMGWIIEPKLNQTFRVMFEESQSFKARCPSCCHLKLAGDCITYMDIRESCFKHMLMTYVASCECLFWWNVNLFEHKTCLKPPPSFSDQSNSINHIRIDVYTHMWYLE